MLTDTNTLEKVLELPNTFTLADIQANEHEKRLLLRKTFTIFLKRGD